LVDLSLTLRVASGSVIGALVGSSILNRFPVNILRKVFGLFMIIAAVRMVL